MSLLADGCPKFLWARSNTACHVHLWEGLGTLDHVSCLHHRSSRQTLAGLDCGTASSVVGSLGTEAEGPATALPWLSPG